MLYIPTIAPSALKIIDDIEKYPAPHANGTYPPIQPPKAAHNIVIRLEFIRLVYNKKRLK